MKNTNDLPIPEHPWYLQEIPPSDFEEGPLQKKPNV